MSHRIIIGIKLKFTNKAPLTLLGTEQAPTPINSGNYYHFSRSNTETILYAPLHCKGPWRCTQALQKYWKMLVIMITMMGVTTKQ